MSKWRESDHPRDGDGRFTEAGGWAGGILRQMKLDSGRPSGEQEILRILRQGRAVEETELTGGQMSATNVVTFEMPDGSKVRLVHKDHWNPVAAADEARLSRLGQALGAPILPVIVDPDDENANWMPLFDGLSVAEIAWPGGAPGPYDSYYNGTDARFWDGDDEDIDPDEVDRIQEELRIKAAADMAEMAEADRRQGEVVARHQFGDQWMMLGLFDLLISNKDRHDGNWMESDDQTRILGIDHTHHAFGGRYGTADMEGRWVVNRFTAPFLNMRGSQVAAHELHPDDMALIAERLESVRREFADHEWADIQNRLRIIAASAVGDTRRLS